MPEHSVVFEVVTWLIPLVLAIVLHEVAHGLVANALGDPTARDAGRLSLDPARHIDPVGTVILPLIMVIAHAPVFGWAKPVPINPSRLRNPRWGGLLVTAAGPGTNLLLALLASAGMAAMLGWTHGEGFWRAFLLANLFNFVLVNLFLGVFNLIPVPPFDGGNIVAALLPPPLGARWRALGRYGLLIMLLLLVVLPSLVPGLNILGWIVGPPVAWLLSHLRALFGF